jgi:hypothetical protein
MEFRVEKLGVAAFLVTRGIAFLRIESNPQKSLRARLFVFSDGDGTARDLEREFYTGGTVQAAAFDRSIAYLKQLLKEDGAGNFGQAGQHGGAK